MRRAIEYCPVTAGVEAVGDRWTLLVLRELLLGSCRFNDIHRGLPGISRTLLSARLRRMTDLGLLSREPDETNRPRYLLTPAGSALEPLVWQLGDWARRWFFGEPETEQLDSGWLLWRLRQFVREDMLPQRRVVVEFVLTDERTGERTGDRTDDRAGRRTGDDRTDGQVERAWLVLAPGDVSACRQHPGHDIDVWVSADLRELHRVVAGTRTLAAATKDGLLRLDGVPGLVTGFPHWFAWRSPAS